MIDTSRDRLLKKLREHSSSARFDVGAESAARIISILGEHGWPNEAKGPILEELLSGPTKYFLCMCSGGKRGTLMLDYAVLPRVITRQSGNVVTMPETQGGSLNSVVLESAERLLHARVSAALFVDKSGGRVYGNSGVMPVSTALLNSYYEQVIPVFNECCNRALQHRQRKWIRQLFGHFLRAYELTRAETFPPALINELAELETMCDLTGSVGAFES